MEHDRTLSQIARGLTWIGAAFLAASAAVIVWAVFRTVGVDDLIVALTVAGLGLGLPAGVAFVVAWILNSLGNDDAEVEGADEDDAPQTPARVDVRRMVIGYGIAVVATATAWALRVALDPVLAQQVAYAPFLLSVVFSAWFGGFGPAVCAALLGGTIAWYAYLTPAGEFGPLSIPDAVQLGLYIAAALCIGGIASALRASRERAHSLAREVLAREAGLEKTRGELAAERDRSQVTLQAIAEAVVATDAQGNITFMNDCAAQLTGWPASEAAGRPVAKIFRTLDGETRRWIDFPPPAGNGSGQQDVVLVARGGAERVVAAQLSPIRSGDAAASGSVLVFRDITQARQARAALEESEARFRLMADQTPVLLWMCDERRAFVYVNRSWLDFTGRTLAQERDDGWTAGIHPEDFGPQQAAFADAFAKREPFVLEYRLRRSDGEYRWVLDNGAPRFDGDGRFAGYIGACIDVTERKEAAATIGNFEQRKSTFLASLAHELRNPLAPIRSSIELLQRIPANNDPRAIRAQDIIERQCARLAELVDDLLDLSRIDSGNIPLKSERVDLAQAIERAVARHAANIRDRKQQLQVDAPRERIRVVADAERLTQIIGNLIGNASKFTQPSGQLRVSASIRDDATAQIVVADDGPGIEPERQPALFDLFDRAGSTEREASQGLGTGLALVSRLARLMGGTISVASEGAGKGSAFTLRLPLAQGAAAGHAAPLETDEAPPGQPRVLIVDDNVDAADAIATLLGLNGFTVETAHDPASAMERAAASDPDVVLLDIGLPGMTGYELARQFSSHPVVSRAKLIALTGYGQPGDTEQAGAAGFAGYLVKPIDVDQLRERIEAILAADAPRRRR